MALERIRIFVGHPLAEATIGIYVLVVCLCALCALCALCVCMICEWVCCVFGWILMDYMMVVIGDRPS